VVTTLVQQLEMALAVVQVAAVVQDKVQTVLVVLELLGKVIAVVMALQIQRISGTVVVAVALVLVEVVRL
jgi:hypothetical protein